MVYETSKFQFKSSVKIKYARNVPIAQLYFATGQIQFAEGLLGGLSGVIIFTMRNDLTFHFTAGACISVKFHLINMIW